MKRALISVLCIFSAIFIFSSCGSNKSEETTAAADISSTASENTAVTVEKSEFESVAGANVDIPEKAENENYYVIQQDAEKFGQVTFSSGNADYVLRIVNSDEFSDISGCYYKWNSTDECEINGCKAEVHLFKSKTENCSVIIWFDSAECKMYSLTTDSAVTKDVLINLASEI